MDSFCSSSCALFLLALLLLLLLLVSTRLKLARGPLPLPVIGHLHLVQGGPLHHSLARLSARYGAAPVLFLRFGSRSVLVVSSPSAAEECFTSNDLAFANRPLLLSGKHFNYDGTTLVVAPYGPHWRSLRRLATLELLSPARLSTLAPVRAAIVRSLLHSIFLVSSSSSSSSKEDWFLLVDIRSRLMEMTLNMLVEMITGKRCPGGAKTDEEGKRFAHLMEEIFHISSTASAEDFLPFLKWMGVNGLQKRMRRMAKEMDGLLQEMVEVRRRGRMDEAGQRSAKDDAEKNIVDVMLSMKEQDPQAYTDTIIKGMIEVLVLGGTDTTTTTMEWAMSLLLNHPETLEKVHEEIEAHVGHERLVTDSDLPKLRFLNNVLKETLRLFPPGPLLVPRESINDCKIGGVHVPRGTMLLVNAHLIHRDPELWTDPEKFKPERFETDGEGEGYKYIPFGAGRRRCPGEALGVKASGLVLASLIQGFEWKRVGEEEVDLTEEDKGLAVPKAVPLVAMCKPRKCMVDVLSAL